MIDYSKCRTSSAEPEASSIIETFRAIGYSIQGAVTIIDNSKSAGAKNVFVDFEWKGADTSLFIKDDDSGMKNENLFIHSLKTVSKNPLLIGCAHF